MDNGLLYRETRQEVRHYRSLVWRPLRWRPPRYLPSRVIEDPGSSGFFDQRCFE